MILCIDVDNVICNLQEAVTNLFNQRHDTNYTLDYFTEYNIENILPIKEAAMMKEMYNESGIYDYVKPIAGSQDGLKKLIADGHHVYLVTASHSKIYHEKVEWIRHFFPFIDDAHVISMKHKHLFKCDIMVEDNTQNLIAGLHYERICFNYPWNKKIHDEAYNIHRCNNWNEIVNVVNQIEQG